MALKPNMSTHDWNEYYLVLAAAILPAIAYEFGSDIPDIFAKIIMVINTGIVATLAFIRKER